MEDEEEINSHSKSPTPSPPQNSQLREQHQPVTVASVAPPARHSLTLALPIQPRQAGTGTGTVAGAGASHGREDCWSEGATSTLIDAWGERYMELSRGNLKQKHWKEVAEVVTSREDYTKTPKTDIQCKNRIDTVKKKYKNEKAKISSGIPTKWPFFDRIDQLIGPTKNEDQHNHRSEPVTKIAAVRSARSLRNRPVKEPESGNSADSTDGFPPERSNVKEKKRRFEKESNNLIKCRTKPETMKELSSAILKFGEAFERVERSKLEQVMEMEQQRMEFTRELELQRIQFFMKTQIEISQLKHGKRMDSNGRHLSNNSS